MNTINILCYGDSNTWGHIPGNKGRYSRDERWTGILQNMLGSKSYVIEEGLGGRTTNIDDPTKSDKNGKAYLNPCLRSHSPLDIVIIMLGSNDLKTYFHRTAQKITQGIQELIDIVKSDSWKTNLESPEIIIIAPPKINESVMTEYKENFKDGETRYNGLPVTLAKLSNHNKCHFLDLSIDIKPSDIDGLHLDRDSHTKIAELLNDKIRKIIT